MDQPPQGRTPYGPDGPPPGQSVGGPPRAPGYGDLPTRAGGVGVPGEPSYGGGSGGPGWLPVMVVAVVPSSSGGFTSGSADPAGFIAQLLADFTACTGAERAGDGDLAAATCGSAQADASPLHDWWTANSLFQQ